MVATSFPACCKRVGNVLGSPADPVNDATTGLIETLIQSALNEPDDSDHRAAAISAERKLKLA